MLTATMMLITVAQAVNVENIDVSTGAPLILTPKLWHMAFDQY